MNQNKKQYTKPNIIVVKLSNPARLLNGTSMPLGAPPPEGNPYQW